MFEVRPNHVTSVLYRVMRRNEMTRKKKNVKNDIECIRTVLLLLDTFPVNPDLQ